MKKIKIKNKHSTDVISCLRLACPDFYLIVKLRVYLKFAYTVLLGAGDTYQ